MARLDRLLDLALEEGLQRHLPDDPDDASDLQKLYAAAVGDVPSLDFSPIEHAALSAGLSADLQSRRRQPGSRVGPFEIERAIGSGGMGTVYLAHRVDGGFEQRVALKMLNTEQPDPSVFQLFQRERQLLAQLEHPGIARLVDGGLTEAWQPWFAMEFIHGQPLDQYCDSRRIPITQRLVLLSQVCRSLDHAHRRLILHRDIKPGNLLVTTDGRTHLVDFGLGRILDEWQSDRAQTTIAAGRMTPQYASPEQARGETVGVASDVYQLGLVIYRLLCGKMPYDTHSLSAYALAERISGAAIPPPSEQWQGIEAEQRAQAMFGQPARSIRRALQGDLDNIVMKTLQRRPEDRYAGVMGLADDLERHLALQPVSARAATWRYRVGRFIRRHAVSTGLAALAVLVLVAGLATVLVQSRQLENERDRAIASAQRNERLADALAGMIRLSDASGPVDQLFTVGERLEQYRDHVRRELDDDPRIQARLLGIIGEAFLNLRYWDEARITLTEALSTLDHRGAFEPGSRRRMALLLAEAEAFSGDLPHAWLRLDALLADTKNGDPATAQADVLYQRGYLKTYHLDAATPEYISGIEDLQAALSIYREQHQAVHPDIARTLHALGLKHPDPDTALKLANRAIDMTRTLFGDSHETTATRLAELALLHDRLGQYEKAARIGREAHELHAALRGATHPESLTMLSNLAGSLRESGALGQAVAIYQRTHALRRQTLPDDHLLLAFTAHGLGNTYRELGQFEESERWLREALRLCRVHSSPNEAVTRVNLSRTLEADGRLVAAFEEQKAALDAYRQHYDNEHPTLASARARLARLERLVESSM